MLSALIAGEQDAEVLADLARGRLRAKLPALRQALEGRVHPTHRFLLERQLAHIQFLEDSLASVQQEMEQHLRPFEEALALLQSIAGIHLLAAITILSEIGIDMSRFPSAKHLSCLRGSVSRQQAEWRQAPQWQDDQREPLPASDLVRSGLGHRPHQRPLFVGLLPPHGSPT